MIPVCAVPWELIGGMLSCAGSLSEVSQEVNWPSVWSSFAQGFGLLSTFAAARWSFRILYDVVR